MGGTNNIEIRNGTIRNFYDYGILMSGCSNVEISGVTIGSSGKGGVRESLSTGRGHRIINVRAIGNGLYGNYSGINLNSKHNLVKDCSAETNAGYGIFIGEASVVTGSICYNNGFHGILATFNSTLTGNICNNNGVYGIYALGGSTLTGNTCNSNGTAGIRVDASSTVAGNTCYGNDGSGFLVGAGCTVIGNTSRDNQDWGVELFGAGNHLIDQNTVTNNNQSGGAFGNIEPSATSTFGLNHAP